MYTPQNPNQRFKLTPIAIMLASSVFMLAYSLFQMTDMNSLMLSAIKKQEHSSTIHSNIYTGITKRSQTLFKILNSTNKVSDAEEYIRQIGAERNILKENQVLCTHNKVKPFHPIFVKQGKLLKQYTSLEDKVIDFFNHGEKELALSLFRTDFFKLREEVLNQIIVEKNYIRVNSNDLIKEVNDKTFVGIFIYSFLNILFLVISLFFSVRLLKTYISNNKALIDSTKHDTLTNLSNRLHLLEEIDEQFKNHSDSSFAVAFIDIDYFKSINDIYGHTLADKLLIEFANNLSAQLQEVKHCLARFGGDEFVLLIKDKTKPEVEQLIKNISNAINTNYSPQGKTIGLSSSIGVSMYPNDASTVEMLLHNSDLAMYQAKKDGRACYRLFSKNLKNEILLRNDILQRLQTSLSKQENVFLVYQPLFNTKTGSVTECEALLRWHDSKLGEISPEKFIPIAEKTNLIKAVNYYVIDEACKQQQKWAKTNTSEIRININLAGNQDIFISSLKRLVGNIHRLNLSPSLFGVEITERSLFEINEETVDQLRVINTMGIKVSIDDFGTGYSSLIYLSKLPLTTLKIDKEFISNIYNKEKDNAIILSIIKLGQSLNLDIVAEGVETHQQCQYLKSHSCDVIQGYLFSKPITAKEMENLEDLILNNESKKRACKLNCCNYPLLTNPKYENNGGYQNEAEITYQPISFVG